jgi:hypothetical protein
MKAILQIQSNFSKREQLKKENSGFKGENL